MSTKYAAGMILLLICLAGCGDGSAQEGNTDAVTLPVVTPSEHEEPVTKECDSGCFQTHMTEAIENNLTRMPLYAELTDGATTALSLELIAGEVFALPFSIIVDEMARPWQENGVCLTCDSFVSMDLTPDFSESYAEEPLALSEYVSRNGTDLAAGFREIFHEEGYDALAAVAEAEIAALESVPSHYCMLRHVLESLLRIATLAPLHEQEAATLGLESPDEVSSLMVELHILILELSTSLDDKAAPFQSQGIPIICQDVPPISPHP